MFAWIILESIVSIPNGCEILMVSLAFDLNFLSLKNTHKKQQPLKIVCEGHAVLCIMRISASISICLLDTYSRKKCYNNMKLRKLSIFSNPSHRPYISGFESEHISTDSWIVNCVLVKWRFPRIFKFQPISNYVFIIYDAFPLDICEKYKP